MKAKDRIAQLEAELVEVRAELNLVEEIDRLERELAEIRRRISTRRWGHPMVPWTQPYWQIYSSSGTGQLGSPPPYTNVNTITQPTLFTHRRDDGPDSGVLAKVS